MLHPKERKPPNVLPRRPGKRFFILLGLLCAAMLATTPLQNRLSTLPLFWLGCAIFAAWWAMGFFWLLSGLAGLYRVLTRREVFGEWLGSWWRWFVSAAVVMFMTYSPWGMNLKFWIARPSLERYAAELTAAPNRPRPNQENFWFMHARDIRVLPGGGIRFQTFVAGNPFDYEGLAYSPTPLPIDEDVDGSYYTPYCGNWYFFWRPLGEPDAPTTSATSKPSATW